MLLMVGSFAVVLWIGQQTNPQPVRIVVAARDLAPGERLTADALAVTPIGLVDAHAAVVSTLITEQDAGNYLGAVVVAPIYANQPVLRGALGDLVDAVTLSGRLEADEVAVFLPVDETQVPDGVRVGDYIDLVFGLGEVNAAPLAPDPKPDQGARLNAGAAIDTDPAQAPAGPETGEATPGPVQFAPLAKTVLTNLEVLEVVRASETRTASDGTQTVVSGAVEGLVLRVPRDGQEVLQFALDNGQISVALVSAEVAASGVAPGTRRTTLGMTWNDFVARVERDRTERLQAGLIPDELLGPGAALVSGR
jgi:Flp pilus assembly protein CpaB